MKSFMPTYENKEVQTEGGKMLKKKSKIVQSLDKLNINLQENDNSMSSISLPSDSASRKKESKSRSSSSSSSKTITLTKNASQQQLSSRRETEKQPGEETMRKMEHAQKVKDFIKWLVDAERNVLVKAERAAEENDSVDPNQIKIWREEIIIPGRFKDVKLTKEQLAEVQEMQREQAEYFKERALRKIEEGSQYSSDYEEADVSEYLTSDGEGKSP